MPRHQASFLGVVVGRISKDLDGVVFFFRKDKDFGNGAGIYAPIYRLRRARVVRCSSTGDQLRDDNLRQGIDLDGLA